VVFDEMLLMAVVGLSPRSLSSVLARLAAPHQVNT
jgi:hypothetical protein